MHIVKRLKRRVLVAAVVAGGLGVSAAGASAFTNSGSFSNTNTDVSYGSQNVTGATVVSVAYTVDSNATHITAVDFDTDGDTRGNTGYVGFTVGGVAQPTVTCSVAADLDGSGNTDYTCTGLDQSITGITSTNFTVS